MQADELITQVDENDKKIGIIPRSQFAEATSLHRSSYLILLNSKNEILLQRRALSKKWHPGLLTFGVAGTVQDESYEECMQREVKDGLGVSLPLTELFKYPHFDNVDKAFKTVFTAKAEPHELKLNDEYADQFLWTSLSELKNDIFKNPQKYAPPFIAGMKIYFEKIL